MARIGISITKTTVYRNSNQEFTNVYYFDGLASQPDASQADSLIDEVANKEKAFHASVVSFVRGRLWSQVGGPSQNEMISQKNLTGTGARTTVGSMDKERAFLFRLRAGSDSRGRPVYLRKYFHACGEFVSGQTPSAAILAQTTGFSTAERNAQVGNMNTIGTIGTGATEGRLTSKSGRGTTPGALWEAHPFLEHHQLGNQWRAN